MGSTFMGMEIARRGLMAHQQALQTTGHNISNADNPHYARQRVNLNAMTPLYNPSLNREARPGMIGQGVEVGNIERVRDHFVDDRIMETQQAKSYWSAKERYFDHIEIIYNEPAKEAIAGTLGDFWQSWQELAAHPEERAHREIVKVRAEDLAYNISTTYEKLDQLRKQADFEIETTVARLNTISFEVRELNEKILKSETMGDQPNDLLDRRDQLVEELSGMANVSVSRSDKDELIVYVGGEALVQGEHVNKLITVGDPANEGLSAIRWEHNNAELITENGSLHALKEMRDQVIKENIDKVDLMAVNLAQVVNEIHRDGFGLNKETNVNFFTFRPLANNIMGNVDLDNDGQLESTGVFAMTGNNTLEENRPIGINGVITLHQNDEAHTPVEINYRATDTVKDVIDKINHSDAGVVAYLDHQDRLVIKGMIAEDQWQKNFIMRHVEDSGEFLVGFSGILQNSGPAGAFDYRRIDDIQKLASSQDKIIFTPAHHPAGRIRLNEQVAENIDLIAASSGRDTGGTGDLNEANGNKDGSNALAISQAIRHNSTMSGDHKNVESFYQALIAKLGVESRESKDRLESQQTILTNLEGLRQSVMGVNLDEEMANMVKFQHAYNASARVLQTMNEMLDQLINRLG